jgi:hypothetical protein
VCINPFAMLQWSTEDRRCGSICNRSEENMVTDNEGSGVCIGATALGTQEPRDVAGAVKGAPWDSHVECRSSDRVTRRMWCGKKAARLSCPYRSSHPSPCLISFTRSRARRRLLDPARVREPYSHAQSKNTESRGVDMCSSYTTMACGCLRQAYSL